MYSEEIDELIKLREYIISNYEYLKICNESPQINRVKYEEDGSGYDYNIWTKDNYYWKVKVYRKEFDKKE